LSNAAVKSVCFEDELQFVFLALERLDVVLQLYLLRFQLLCLLGNTSHISEKSGKIYTDLSTYFLLITETLVYCASSFGLIYVLKVSLGAAHAMCQFCPFLV